MRPDTAYIADALRQYADALTAGELDGAGRYLPADLNEAADEIEGDVNDLLNVCESLVRALDDARSQFEHVELLRTARAVLAKAEPARFPEAPMPPAAEGPPADVAPVAASDGGSGAPNCVTCKRPLSEATEGDSGNYVHQCGQCLDMGLFAPRAPTPKES